MALKHSKLSPRQHGELLKIFVGGSTARTAAELVGVHRNTAALFFRKLRQLIAEHQERELCQAFDGQVEIDESYFGGRRKGKRGRGAAGKVAVFGLLKRGGKVYTQMIADCKRHTLMPIIRLRVAPRQRGVLRHVCELQHAGLGRLPPRSDLPRQHVRRARRTPHQRDRELLEPGQASPAEVQRRPERIILSVAKRVQVAVEHRKCRQPAKIIENAQSEV